MKQYLLNILNGLELQHADLLKQSAAGELEEERDAASNLASGVWHTIVELRKAMEVAWKEESALTPHPCIKNIYLFGAFDCSAKIIIEGGTEIEMKIINDTMVDLSIIDRYRKIVKRCNDFISCAIPGNFTDPSDNLVL